MYWHLSLLGAQDDQYRFIHLRLFSAAPRRVQEGNRLHYLLAVLDGLEGGGRDALEGDDGGDSGPWNFSYRLLQDQDTYSKDFQKH